MNQSTVSQAKQSARLRLRLWLISSGAGALVWALVLAALFHFATTRLPLEAESAAVAVKLIRDRFLFSFGFTAPLLGALAYFAILLIAGQQQEINETKAQLTELKTARPKATAPASDGEAKEAADLDPATVPPEDRSKTDDPPNTVLQANLIALLSREYRTPLTAILSSSELIEHYGDRWTPDRIQRHLVRIKASVGVMTSLLNETLMLVGESETGALTFEPVVLNLNQFITDLVEGLGLTDATQDSSRIHCDLLADAVSVHGDPKLLRSLLTPVLGNALKYSPDDSMVRLILTHDGNQASLTVQDKGMGIAEADQSRVFEPFFRGEKAKSKAGTGLGLAIARVCAELHGGAIALSSTDGEGTCITMTLPMPQIEPSAIETTTPADTTALPSGSDD